MMEELIRAQSIYKLATKFHEIARPNRLPYASHGVKEEGQIVVRKQYTCKHFSAQIKIPEIRASMPAANQTFAGFIERPLVLRPASILNV